MSRRLFRTSEYKSKIKRELENKLSKMAFDPSTYPETTKDKAVVVITMEAKEKMSALVNSVPTETRKEAGKRKVRDIRHTSISTGCNVCNSKHRPRKVRNMAAIFR